MLGIQGQSELQSKNLSQKQEMNSDGSLRMTHRTEERAKSGSTGVGAGDTHTGGGVYLGHRLSAFSRRWASTRREQGWWCAPAEGPLGPELVQGSEWDWQKCPGRCQPPAVESHPRCLSREPPGRSGSSCWLLCVEDRRGSGATQQTAP